MWRLNAALNRLYCGEPCLWEDDFTPNGFQWIEGGDIQQSVVSYLRWNKAHTDAVAVILNLTPVVRENYTIGVPFPGEWCEVLNTDDHRFGGTGLLNGLPLKAEKGLYHGMDQHLSLRLPWLSGIILKPVRTTEK